MLCVTGLYLADITAQLMWMNGGGRSSRHNVMPMIPVKAEGEDKKYRFWKLFHVNEDCNVECMPEFILLLRISSRTSDQCFCLQILHQMVVVGGNSQGKPCNDVWCFSFGKCISVLDRFFCWFKSDIRWIEELIGYMYSNLFSSVR